MPLANMCHSRPVVRHGFLMYFSLSFAALGFAGNPLTCWSQTAQGPSVRVETREVALPVVVVEEKKDPKGLIVEANGDRTPAWVYSTEFVDGLSQESFRVFEDGKEQKIQQFSIEAYNKWLVKDNVGVRLEHSWTPAGIWSGADNDNPHISITDSTSPWRTYLITYTPPPSIAGSCHQITLKVEKKHSTIHAPQQYCNTKEPLSDPLDGTEIGKRLLEYAKSKQPDSGLLEARPDIPLTMQLTAFSGISGGRLNVSLQIPSDRLHREWRANKLVLPVAVLGLVYDKNHALVTRFSDLACPSTQCLAGIKGFIPASTSAPTAVAFHRWAENLLVPSHYRTQLELDPGEYQVELIITDGEKFGRTEASFSVPDFGKKGLAISGIALCKRYHTPSPNEKGPTRAPQYARLIFDGKEFTPAGSTHFKANEEVMVYLEIYGSSNGVDPRQKLFLEMKINNTVNNQLVVGTGLRPLTSADASKTVIPMVWQMAANKLPPGIYRVEIQASDSTGNKSEWRSASFVLTDSAASPGAARAAGPSGPSDNAPHVQEPPASDVQKKTVDNPTDNTPRVQSQQDLSARNVQKKTGENPGDGASGAQAQQELSADDILKKVSETYRQASGFSLVADGKIDRDGDAGLTPNVGGFHGSDSVEVILMGSMTSSSPKAKLLLKDENKEIVVVNDGMFISTLLTAKHEYTVADFRTSYTPVGSDEISGAGLLLEYEFMTATSFRKIDRHKASTKLDHPESLKVGNDKKECYVLTVEIAAGSQKLWVDKTDFIVWKTVMTAVHSWAPPGAWNAPGATMKTTTTLTMKQIALSPTLDDSNFVFTPPDQAKKVDSLTLPARNPF